jgi:molecular chaperone GrpE
VIAPQGDANEPRRAGSDERPPAGPDATSRGPAGGGDASVLGPSEPAPPAGRHSPKDPAGSAARAADDAGAEVEADLDALAAAEQERDEYLELAKRTQADFENYRKRMAAEVQAAAVRGKAELAAELIGVLDNLERALAAAGVEPDSDEAPAEPLAEGFFLTYRELCAALQRVGVESFDPDGEQFDPSCHEALQKVAADGSAPGTVVEVMQKGYRLGERLIRPARVVVSE